MLKQRRHKRKAIASTAAKINRVAFGVGVFFYQGFKSPVLVVGVNIKYFVFVCRGLFVPMFGVVQGVDFTVNISTYFPLRALNIQQPMFIVLLNEVAISD